MSLYALGPWLPGPWVVEAVADRNVVGVADASGSPICELWHGVEGWTLPSHCTTKEWKLDHASLIAAAPELFALVQAIARGRGHCFIPTDDPSRPTFNWDQLALAALAKAKGESA